MLSQWLDSSDVQDLTLTFSSLKKKRTLRQTAENSIKAVTMFDT